MTTRFAVLNEVHQRLHDMKNLQRASAWPHVDGVARAEKMVWDMIAACQPKDSEPFVVKEAVCISENDLYKIESHLIGKGTGRFASIIYCHVCGSNVHYGHMHNCAWAKVKTIVSPRAT